MFSKKHTPAQLVAVTVGQVKASMAHGDFDRAHDGLDALNQWLDNDFYQLSQLDEAATGFVDAARQRLSYDDVTLLTLVGCTILKGIIKLHDEAVLRFHTGLDVLVDAVKEEDWRAAVQLSDDLRAQVFPINATRKLIYQLQEVGFDWGLHLVPDE